MAWDDPLDLFAHQIASAVRARMLMASDVVQRFISRIEEIEGAVNSVVYRRFDEALEDARRVDADVARGVDPGPLAGVPISIKESYHLAGSPSTLGVSRFLEEKIVQDSELVAKLKAAGAVVVAKTNVPQLMVLHETDNPVFGRTNNPWDLARTPGGSTGGEAALLAARGSALGLGSDMGGSIRYPAHVCGVAGFKPTTHLLTNTGARMTFPGLEAIGSSPGPMGRCVEDLEIALRVMAAPGPALRPDVSPPTVGDVQRVDVPALRIGYFTDDGYMTPSPAIRRVVETAAARLQEIGCRVEAFEPPGIPDAVQTYYGLVSADGAAAMRQALGNCEADPRVRRLIRLATIPTSLRPALAWWLESTGQIKLGRLVSGTGPISTADYWRLTAAKQEFSERFFTAWRDSGADVLIGPPHALPAMHHGASVDLTTAASYCFLANMLHLPAGVIPAGTVREGEESDRPASTDQVDRAARRVEVGSQGLPLGVQVMGRPHHDHLALAVMRTLEWCFRTHSDYPDRPPEPIGGDPETSENLSDPDGHVDDVSRES